MKYVFSSLDSKKIEQGIKEVQESDEVVTVVIDGNLNSKAADIIKELKWYPARVDCWKLDASNMTNEQAKAIVAQVIQSPVKKIKIENFNLDLNPIFKELTNKYGRKVEFSLPVNKKKRSQPDTTESDDVMYEPVTKKTFGEQITTTTTTTVTTVLELLAVTTTTALVVGNDAKVANNNSLEQLAQQSPVERLLSGYHNLVKPIAETAEQQAVSNYRLPKLVKLIREKAEQQAANDSGFRLTNS